MKSYTSVAQSRKLAEILPIESADMYYPNRTDIQYQGALPIGMKMGNPLLSQEIPAWSLGALLGVLPSATLDSSDDRHYRVHCNKRFTDWHNNPIDACVDMVIKLYELNLL